MPNYTMPERLNDCLHQNLKILIFLAFYFHVIEFKLINRRVDTSALLRQMSQRRRNTVVHRI